jgi:hypothetical protein
MFIPHQNAEQIEYYRRMLSLFGSLTRLFSESNNPFIEYRTAENLFCKAFDARNLGRADVSADAAKEGLGIGIKTFLDKNGSSFEKIAEFNDASPHYRDLSDIEKVRVISDLRNQRIEFTKRAYGIDNLIYHCVTRADGKIYVYECGLNSIDMDRVRLVATSKSSLDFSDGIEDYRFSRSKSTLYKRFSRKNSVLEIPVNILPDPYSALEELLSDSQLATHPLDGEQLHVTGLKDRIVSSIYLPLYKSRGDVREVPEKSGLNQWNAGGRARHHDEVYIPIPSWIHKKFPDFFPPRDEPFSMTLPDGKELSAKVCQQGSKALMSNPNKALGQWLLREVMNLRERELLTYERLESIGVDSVLIDKLDDGAYQINFSRVDSFEEFKSGNAD